MSAIAPRRAWGRWALLAVTAWLVGYPLVVTLWAALEPMAGGAFGSPIAAFLRHPGESLALARSLWISVASVALAAAIGVPLAFLFARYEFRGRRILAELVALPVALPPLVGVIAFAYLYGESGIATRAVGALLGRTTPPWRMVGQGAILFVHAYSMYVYFYLFTRAALARFDGALLEAAAALGAGRWRRLLRVELPLLKPALAGAAMLTFLTALGSFSAPYLFGGSYRVMTTQILAAKQNGDVDLAEVETIVLAVISIVALVAARRLEGVARVATAGRAGRPLAPRRPGGGLATLVTLAGWTAAALLLLPHLALVLLSFVPPATWTTEALPPVLGLGNWRALVASAEALRPIGNSLWMALVSTAAALGLGLALARAARAGGALGRALELLVALPWAVPATAFAVALATTFSVRQPLALRFVLVGTAAILPLGYGIRALPTTGRAAASGLAQLDPGLEEAAASLGAGKLRRLWRVSLPLLRPALAAGASLAFLNSFGDFVLSIVLYTYTTRPIAIEILSNLRLQETGRAASYGVVLTVLSAAAFLIWGREKRA